MSGVYEKTLPVRSSDCDMWRRMRLSAFFRHLQDAAGAHAEELGGGHAQTLDRGFLWVLARIRLEFARLPVYDETVTLRTWPGPMAHAVYPRHYVVEDAAGAVLARGASMWLLMDEKTRRMVFPKQTGVTVEGGLRGGELALPGPLRLPEPAGKTARTARYSDADLNGHVNNTRYLDWMDDLFPPEFHRDHELRALQINFSSEIRPGETVTLEYGGGAEDFTVVGRSDRVHFEARARFAG